MTRTSTNEYRDGQLWAGFDYENQAWVENGRYVRCGHPDTMSCGCYGREHEGESTNADLALQEWLARQAEACKAANINGWAPRAV